jgi:hypothetical protein
MEKAPPTFSGSVGAIMSLLKDKVDIELSASGKGAGFDDTGMYQIRIKPTDKTAQLADLLDDIKEVLTSKNAKTFGISKVKINERSPHSGKYSSVQFDFGPGTYDVVVSQGGNKGEHFEQDLLVEMNNYVSGGDKSELAHAAFQALQAADPSLKIKSIKSVVKRAGSTKRSSETPLEETGAIIADIVLVMKNGDKKYISVKNKNGDTVANFSIAGAISNDLKVNLESSDWKEKMAPFGLDPNKIEAGLAEYKGGGEKTPTPDNLNLKVKKGSAIFKIIERMWGVNYYYLREKAGGKFVAYNVDENFILKVLNKLTVTSIKYPSASTKSIMINLEGESVKLRVEFRNKKGGVRPTEITLKTIGSIFA